MYISCLVHISLDIGKFQNTQFLNFLVEHQIKLYVTQIGNRSFTEKKKRKEILQESLLLAISDCLSPFYP